MESNRFLKNHADTIAIIGVNLVIAGILFTMCLSNISRVDALNAQSNARFDTFNARFDGLLISWKEECKDFHGRLCAIEERNRK